MRGEHLLGLTASEARGGSSPRARGAPYRDSCLYLRSRIIPACAGSTTRQPRPSSRRSDHPRVRGEHLISRAISGAAVGSSPRARGALVMNCRAWYRQRIIPACGGSSPRARGARCGPTSRTAHREDHPRVRGEHRERRGSGGLPGRIIPACAGSTRASADARSPGSDHPRVRGEHRWGGWICRPPSGSSPRARGAPNAPAGLVMTGRIIPACAGSTSRNAPRPRSAEDHPRVRGEHRVAATGSLPQPGSSPRARGARRPPRPPPRCCRIIPACAGSTPCPWCRTTDQADHPRVRGEHGCGSPSWSTSAGSSPRARGAHRLRPG